MKKLISVILAVLVLATAVTVGFTVFATEGDGETTDPTQPTEQTVYTPADVTGLSAGDVTTSSLNLSWNQSTYATKYLVYRSSEYNNGTMGDYKKVASVSGIANTSYKETGLKAGRIYKYKVYAYRVKDGTTTHSEPASVVVMTTPSSVSSLTAKAKSTNYITLKWNKITTSTDYLIYKSYQQNDGSYSAYKLLKKVTNPSTTSLKVTKLSSGKFY
ncbi:MAG: fibronectin type III domain-containing protein, partial [Ruminococcus sp.]|nr:fibronectin type III domain-containing protein [Ruminococcus sp.]